MQIDSAFTSTFSLNLSTNVYGKLKIETHLECSSYVFQKFEIL